MTGVYMGATDRRLGLTKADWRLKALSEEDLEIDR
jgi:hypothetical protein